MATYRRITTIIVAATLLGVFCGVALAVDVAPGVQLHGYMQNRVYAAPGASAEFRSERISISAIAALANNSNAYVEWYYHPWAYAPAGGTANGLYLESAYYDTPLGEGRLRIGKGRRMTFGITPSYPNRKTSNYGLIAEGFTQDRMQGVQYMLQKDVLDLGIGIQTAYRMGNRRIGEIPGDNLRNATHQVQHLAFRDNGSGGGSPDEMNSKLGVSARLGGKWKGGFKAGVSYYRGSLDKRDLAELGGAVPAGYTLTNLLCPKNPLTGATPGPLLPGATSKTQNELGLDFSYTCPKGVVLQGEYYKAKISTLKDKGWDLLAGFTPADGWKFFLRYGKQDIGIAPTANPLSWPTKQWSISAVQPLGKALWIQYEYEINSEKPKLEKGYPTSVKNNLFFVELFTGF